MEVTTETMDPSGKGWFGLAPLTTVKLRIALTQALLLHALAASQSYGTWPSTQPAVFAGALLVMLFVPLLVIQAAGQLPWRRLGIWAATAGVLAAVVGAHSVLRRALPQLTPADSFERLIPDPPAVVFLAAGLFIAQALIIAAATDHRRIATYATYFEVAWKQGVQAVAGVGFTVVFWIVLALGGELFKLITLDFLSRLIQHAWFAFPATTLAFAAALHVTDVRPQIIRSIKTLILTLLSWLLPLATVIAAGFLASLPFTGLSALWATKAATPILLGCSAGLVILLNAGYQDGAPERAVPRVMRYIGSLAALLLFPLVAIAAYGVALRVGQYGWTNDRIIAAACVLVAACYALGYLWAALRRDNWLQGLETSNIATSFVALGAIAALFTPLADPARIATASQLARLESGKVAPEKFDFMSLRFDNERYGSEAVRVLAAQAEGPVKTAAARALAAKFKHTPVEGLDAAALTASLKVSPPGATLPDSFLKQDWTNVAEARALSQCMHDGPCTAVLLDVNGDGVQEVAVMGKGSGPATIFGEADGSWRDVGEVLGFPGCEEAREGIEEGHFEMAVPAWREVLVGGRRLPVIPKAEPCTP